MALVAARRHQLVMKLSVLTYLVHVPFHLGLRLPNPIFTPRYRAFLLVLVLFLMSEPFQERWMGELLAVNMVKDLLALTLMLWKAQKLLSVWNCCWSKAGELARTTVSLA